MPKTALQDALLVSYREVSLERAKDYCTTNGLIQVSLCGLFATAIAVLVAFGEQTGTSDVAKNIVYGIIIPTFSFNVLTVSFKVYTWITEQLWYIAHFGRSPDKVKKFMSIEEWQALREEIWVKRHADVIVRAWKIFWGIIDFYVCIPIAGFLRDDIYCYYFLLYIVAPFLSLAHIYQGMDLARSAALVVVGQLISGLIGLQAVVRLGLVGHEIRERLEHDKI